MTSQRRCRPQPLAPPEDETLARDAFTGLLAHRAITAILRDAAGNQERLRAVDWRRALAEADRLLAPASIENRAHRQVIAAAVVVYFHLLLPPPSWIFVAAEPRLPHGRPDAVWRDGRGRVLVDEIKTGWNAAELDATLEQARRYLLAGAGPSQRRTLAVRVLCTADPASSWVLGRDGTALPLAASSLTGGEPGMRRRHRPGLLRVGAGRPLTSQRGPPAQLR